MPQTQTILQVFVASPSDVAEERKILESVIDDINRTASDAHPLRLALLKWETHSYPGFGEDAQAVINQQIGDKYNIFLGIMWGRFGSPTPRAESGTEEEFNRAVDRWKASPERIQIMFYFKDAGIPPSELEPEQLAKVQAFKEKISAQGVYSEFQDAADFRTQASTHLRRVIQDWPKPALSDPETAETTTALSLDQSREALNQEALPASWPRSLQCYADSGSFRDSEKNFLDFITPFSGRLSSDQIDDLLKAVVRNSQNWNARGTPNLLKDLLKNTSPADFPSAEGRNDFFQFLAPAPSSQGQEEDIFSFLELAPLRLYEEVIQLLQADGWTPPRADEEKQIMESPSQPPPQPPEPDKNGRDATAEVESSHRSEAGRESPGPEKGVHWQAVSGVAGILGVVVVIIFGFLDFWGDRQAAESVTKGVVEGLKKFAEINAEAVSKNPGEAAETAARVQRDATASRVDRVRADAILLQREGKIEEAIEKWRFIANVAGEENRQIRARAWFSIGYLRSVGEGIDWEAAIDAYTKATELDPTLAEAYYNRGTVKHDLGQPAVALADYDQAIELNPTYAAAYNNRGNAKRDLSQPAVALADYDEAIELNPTLAAAYNNRGNAKRDLGQPAAALADYDEAIELNPTHAEAYYNRGTAKHDLGQPAVALADYDEAIELNPTYAEAYYNRGTAKHDLGQPAVALADYDEAIELNPTLAEAYNNRGAVKRSLGQPAAALADLDEAIELNPTHAAAYYNLGAAKESLGRISEARADYQQALVLAQEAGKANLVAAVRRNLSRLGNNAAP